MREVEIGSSFGSETLSISNMKRQRTRNQQVTKMLCVLVAVFGLCWAPFHVDRLIWSYIDTWSVQHLKVFEHVHIISGVFFYLSSSINPILYNLMSTRFKEMFRRITCYPNKWQLSHSFQMQLRSTLSKKTDNTGNSF
ncbi:hypothetical protein LDENG_00209390 [Lucifuga dentata]|nr:hypothetical protein LDENG_00209390 [Lucifuga dentata]